MRHILALGSRSGTTVADCSHTTELLGTQMSQRSQKLLKGSLLAAMTLLFSGCALIWPETQDSPDSAAPTVEPPQTSSAPVEPIREIPLTVDSPVAIVVTNTIPAYTNVATELGKLLENQTVYNLADKSRSEKEVFSRIDETEAEAVVAIGLRAATAAKSYSQVPVVFCQVFNVEDNDLISDQVKGVAALPPLDLQVSAWKELNPGIRNIGAIIGEGHESLIEEAAESTEAAGINLHYRVANSDRETLYLFNRLATDIDGFWLFPDNRILSSSVLRQIFKDASRKNVQVAVFNNSLLDLGAAISSTSVGSDIASTIVSVLAGIDSGEMDLIPDITPLTKMEIRTNEAVLKTFRLRADSTVSNIDREGTF